MFSESLVDEDDAAVVDADIVIFKVLVTSVCGGFYILNKTHNNNVSVIIHFLQSMKKKFEKKLSLGPQLLSKLMTWDTTSSFVVTSTKADGKRS